MAKDPAFLFYPGDWLSGTLGMSFEEKGAYLELLMMQFSRGHMTSHMIGQTIGQLWVTVQVKFKQDENGLWFNERLDVEKERRKTFTESRKNNIKGNNQYNKNLDNNAHLKGHMTSHMESENENENTLSSSSLVLSSSSLTPMFQLEYEDLKKDFLKSESWIVTLIRNNPKLKDSATVKKHMIEFCKVLSDANQYPITFKEASNRFSGYLKKIINAPQSGNSDILESKMKVY